MSRPTPAGAHGAAEVVVADALAGIMDGFASAGAKCWRLAAPGTRGARIRVSIEEEWLVVERMAGGTDLSGVSRVRRSGFHALDERDALPSGTRAVLPVRGLRLLWRGERPLGGSHVADGLEEWLRAALGTRVTGRRERAPPTAEAAREAIDIVSLCEEAGWPTTARTGSPDVVIELPAWDAGVCHAVVSHAPTGLRLRVALGAAGDGAPTPTSQAAAAVALLRTAGSVRMVRATASLGEEGIDASLEVSLDAFPGPGAVNHALSALAVAHQQVANEFRLLASEDSVARAYLHIQGVH